MSLTASCLLFKLLKCNVATKLCKAQDTKWWPMKLFQFLSTSALCSTCRKGMKLVSISAIPLRAATVGSQAKGSEGFSSWGYKAPLGYKARCQHLSPGTGRLERARSFFYHDLDSLSKESHLNQNRLCTARLSRAGTSPLPGLVQLCYKQLDAPALSPSL